MRDITPKAEFAVARRHVAAALRSGRTSYPAIVRFVKGRSDEVSELEIYGAILLMQKLGEIEETHSARYRGTVEMTALWPGFRKYYRKDG